MATSKSKAVEAAPADLSQVEPVLFLSGGGSVPSDVPARDLTVADLVRIHHVRAITASESRSAALATAADVDDLATELSSSGAFMREAPAAEPPGEAVEASADGSANELSSTPSETPASPAQEA